MAITRVPILSQRLHTVSIQQLRFIQLPCKTTTNRAATLATAQIPKSETSLTKNVRIINVKTSAPSTNKSPKPLVVILEWLMAKNKHIHKFADVYLNHGFEVMSVRLKPGQLIWPVSGSKLVASSVVDILHSEYAARPILVHGFSVGGYLWGEIQLKIAEDLARYEQLLSNISGAVWDSAVDINETAVGVPVALFPKNAILRNACQKYILYHMKKYEKEATQHWRKSRDMFYRPIVPCPTLLLYSKTDPIGNPTSYANIRKSYESMGIKIFEKCWDKSPHVAHFAFHKEEYLTHLEMFMEKIGLLETRAAERMRATAL